MAMEQGIVLAAMAGPPMRVVLRDLDTDTVVALLALVGAVVAAVLSYRGQESRNVSDMAATQQSLQEQVDSLSRRMGRLYEQNIRLSEQAARDRRDMDEDARYIRSIAHWLQAACEVMDIPEEWAREHPKPHLDESMRARIAPDTIKKKEKNNG